MIILIDKSIYANITKISTSYSLFKKKFTLVKNLYYCYYLNLQIFLDFHNYLATDVQIIIYN